jgi:hypothetical protein
MHGGGEQHCDRKKLNEASSHLLWLLNAQSIALTYIGHSIPIIGFYSIEFKSGSVREERSGTSGGIALGLEIPTQHRRFELRNRRDPL